MDYIKILKADLEKGYSKSDLERLIGLPQNNLSGILKGDRKLSQKSKLKIEIWEKTVKPSPLELVFETATKEAKETPLGKQIMADIIANPTPMLVRDIKPNGEVAGTYDLRTGKQIPPMPTRNKGEDAVDFAARKNEWKKKYNQ